MSGWTEDELAAAVEAYRQMEVRLASGSDIEKARVYRELSARYGRTPKAWEYRMQNISHVLAQADRPWLPGLRPATNVGTKIEQQLARLLALPGAVPTSVSTTTRELLEREVEAAEVSGGFSPTNEIDERQSVLATIIRRRGQPAFRKSLIKAYGGRCAMTGCDALDALEAAHIIPYRHESINAIPNGLLLRADIHTLFDLHLIGVDQAPRRITIAPPLRGSAYSEIHGSPLAKTCVPAQEASIESLAWHRSHCPW